MSPGQPPLACSPATMPTNPSHSRFSLRRLAAAIGGELRLASLPPVDGAATLSSRIVFAPEAVQGGVIFWDLSAPFSRSLRHPEEIFLSGAIGMISARQIEPWAGGFAIHIVDHHRAMVIAQQVARQQLFKSFLPRPTPLASR